MNQKREDGYSLSIDELYAFVATVDGGEGIMGVLLPDGTRMPLIGADMARVESLRPMADMTSKSTGIPYKIVRFKKVEG